MAEIVCTHPQDPRLAAFWPADAAGYEQSSDDEPIFVVVGPKAQPEAVSAICGRFGLDAATISRALGVSHV